MNDDIGLVATQLENEVPWETCGKLMDHTGWQEVVETIRAICPNAYLDLLAYTTQQQSLLS